MNETLQQLETRHQEHTDWRGLWNCPLCSPRPTLCVLAGFLAFVLLVIGCKREPQPAQPVTFPSEPQPAQLVTFPSEALVMRKGKVVKVPCWVKAVPSDTSPGFYDAKEWAEEPFPNCQVLSVDAHYKTHYPMALLPGPGGEGANVIIMH